MNCGNGFVVVLGAPGEFPVAAADGPGAETNRGELKVGVAKSAKGNRCNVVIAINIDDCDDFRSRELWISAIRISLARSTESLSEGWRRFHRLATCAHQDQRALRKWRINQQRGACQRQAEIDVVRTARNGESDQSTSNTSRNGHSLRNFSRMPGARNSTAQIRNARTGIRWPPSPPARHYLGRCGQAATTVARSRADSPARRRKTPTYIACIRMKSVWTTG